MQEKSIFTKIIQKEIPANIVFEDESFICFLDINPLKKGHLLLIPKIQIDKIYDLPDEIYTQLFAKAKEMSKIMEKGFSDLKPELNVKRIGFVVQGFGVPHAHLHLIPISGMHELDPKNNYHAEKEELQEMQEFYQNIFKNMLS
jgi:histidine triad (HIT) family protein